MITFSIAASVYQFSPQPPMSHDPLAWLDDELASLAQRDLIRSLLIRCGPQQAGEIEIAGQSLINFGSNDYLSLADNPRLKQAAVNAIAHSGWGAGASPLVSGHGEFHGRLEQALAAFEGTAAALLFPSGYAANAGTIAALVGSGDAIFSDARNHASIIDGCRLSGARILVYPHGDVDTLREMLAGAGDFRRRLIVTDGLFSMDGDFAPLDQIAGLADEFHCMWMVDEAHATGVLGQRGRGVSELLGVEERVDIRMGTLSKALGSHGGFVAGSQRLIEYLLNRVRPYIFSTASPEASAAAALAALEVVEAEPERRAHVLAIAAALRERLSRAGCNVGRSESQIVPIILGASERALAAARHLRQAGFFVPAIRPPSVPSGESLLRVSLCYGHTQEHLDRLIAELAKLRSQ